MFGDEPEVRPGGAGEPEENAREPKERDADASGPEGAAAGPARAGFRSGYVALAGRPNVGKSTLMNRFLEERLSIVTAKPQTTRRRTLGILNGEGFQMILLDTPGLMDPKYELHRAMLGEARRALADADVVLLLTEPGDVPELPAEIRAVPAMRVLAMNKIDTLRSKADLLPLLDAWSRAGEFREIVPISALHGEGTRTLADILVRLLPEGPAFYPTDQLTDQSERFFVAEIIRERIFELYEKEVPYSTEVEIVAFTERPGAKDYIEALIYVEQESQKAILIGKSGRAIRALGEEAREEIEAFLGRPAYLSLRVRVLPGWRKKTESVRRFGYER